MQQGGFTGALLHNYSKHTHLGRWCSNYRACSCWGIALSQRNKAQYVCVHVCTCVYARVCSCLCVHTCVCVNRSCLTGVWVDTVSLFQPAWMLLLPHRHISSSIRLLLSLSRLSNRSAVWIIALLFYPSVPSHPLFIPVPSSPFLLSLSLTSCPPVSLSHLHTLPISISLSFLSNFLSLPPSFSSDE